MFADESRIYRYGADQQFSPEQTQIASIVWCLYNRFDSNFVNKKSIVSFFLKSMFMIIDISCVFAIKMEGLPVLFRHQEICPEYFQLPPEKNCLDFLSDFVLDYILNFERFLDLSMKILALIATAHI